MQLHRTLYKCVTTKNTSNSASKLGTKKQNFAEGEIAIFDEACVYKWGEYWQFRLWLPKENKYARKRLLVAFRRQKNILSDYPKNQYNAYIEKTDEICMW